MGIQGVLYVFCILVPAERMSERAERTFVTLPIMSNKNTVTALNVWTYNSEKSVQTQIGQF